jgi:nitrous oxide reductase
MSRHIGTSAAISAATAAELGAAIGERAGAEIAAGHETSKKFPNPRDGYSGGRALRLMMRPRPVIFR